MQKVRIPVERVTLGIETATEHETVTAQLRREQIDEPAVVVDGSPGGTDFTCYASR